MLSIRDKLDTCIVCGGFLGGNHHCPDRVEKAAKAAQTRALNAEWLEHETPRYSETTRLCAGLGLMEMEIKQHS